MFDVIDQYLEPHRHYHNINHISNMLSNVHVYNLSAVDKIKLHMAILYHDIVYDPESNVNEENSALYFTRKLIRKEYHMLSDEDYNVGRSKWIKSMLDKPRIFHTAYCIYNGFEEKARTNLQAELYE